MSRPGRGGPVPAPPDPRPDALGPDALGRRAALPARSVLLSLLLGSHPPELPVRALVGTAGLFGIAEGTARVALSRLGADGEVVGDGGTYRLSERHLARQRAQDGALRPPTRPWSGAWELLSLGPPGLAGPTGVGPASSTGAGPGQAVHSVAAARRMAELSPGLWVRPDNLDLGRPDLPTGANLWLASVESGARPDPGQLWDLAGWSALADRLLAELRQAHAPADRLAVAAAMVRHIRADPLLPAEMLPARWPGQRLRRAYDDYRAELGRLITSRRDL